MSNEILININSGETRVALLENGVLVELYVERKNPQDGEYDMEFILKRLNEIGSDCVYKGTFYFAVTNDIARLIAEKYSSVSH